MATVSRTLSSAARSPQLKPEPLPAGVKMPGFWTPPLPSSPVPFRKAFTISVGVLSAVPTAVAKPPLPIASTIPWA